MSSTQTPSPRSKDRPTRYLSKTLDRSHSRSYVTKDISLDEGDALKRITQEAEQKLADEKKKNAEARKYYQQMKDQEQSRFSDEEMDSSVGGVATSTPISAHPRKAAILDDMVESSARGSRNYGSRPSSAMSQQDDSLANGMESVRIWQDKYNELDSKYKDAMVSNAKQHDEKTALVYQVESLKDLLEDRGQEVLEAKSETQRKQSQLLHSKHHQDALTADIQRLKAMVKYRDDYLESVGLSIPDEETSDLPEVFPVEERDKLLKEIAQLKSEVEMVKSAAPVAPADSLLFGEETKDIVRESTRLVSEYKTKLQISVAETNRLEGTVERLKGQVGRYKSQMEDMEQREDELLKEKRGQSREVRRLQSLVDDLESENELLKRRIEQMRKRQKD